MITAIAFDFTEVLFTRKLNVQLTSRERKIAERFGFLSPDAVFLDHFVQELGISKEEVEAEVKSLVAKIYQLKEPDLFEKIPRFKFAAATNHLSYYGRLFLYPADLETLCRRCKLRGAGL